jgi:hypothetical protein
MQTIRVAESLLQDEWTYDLTLPTPPLLCDGSPRNIGRRHKLDKYLQPCVVFSGYGGWSTAS